MPAAKPYRNAIRSKNAIRSAFIELLNEKNSDRITVTDIVSRADINRSTFYAHYPDVQGLLEEIGGEIMSTILQFVSLLANKNLFSDPLGYLLAICEAFNENVELYRAISRSQYSDPLAVRLKKLLMQSVIDSLPLTGPQKASGITRARVSFCIGGMVDISMMWFRGELDCSLEDIAADLANTISRIDAESLLDEWTK